MNMSATEPLERVKGFAVIRRMFLGYPDGHQHRTEINDTSSRELLESAVVTASAMGCDPSAIAEAADMTIAEIARIAPEAA